MNVPQRDLQLKRSKVKVTGREKPQEIAAYLTYMFTDGRRIKRARQLDGRPHIMSALGADIFLCLHMLAFKF